MNRPLSLYFLLTAVLWGSFSLIISAQTIFAPGDLAIIGVNANLNGCGGDSGTDEVSFVCFKDIETNTVLQITDNGYQRKFPGQWGNSEGFITVRRTGSTIPAGTIITFRFPPIAGGYQAILPDSDWEFMDEAFNSINFNSGGDQFYFMQGGVWDNGTILSGFNFQHDATYTGGTILFGFNSSTSWIDFADDPQDSGLHPDVVPCYYMAPTGGTTNFISYAMPSAPTQPTTQLEWIARFANPNNWTSYPSCPDYMAPPAQITIEPSGMFIDCSTCSGCIELTDTLVFGLPFGGPYRVRYTNGVDTFLLENASDGITQIVTVNENTQYDMVSVEEENGCPIYSSFERGAFLEVLEPTTGVLDTTICQGESLTVNGTVYDENRPAGTEILQASTGCDSVLVINLSFQPGLEGKILGDTLICPGTSATLVFELSGATLFDVLYSDGNSPPVQLNGIRTGYNIEVFPDTTSVYSILSIQSNTIVCGGSSAEGAKVRIEPPNVDLVASDFGGYNISCASNSDGMVRAEPSGGEAPYSFVWNTGATSEEISKLDAGFYEIMVTDAAGCTTTRSINLTAPEPIQLSTGVVSPGCQEGEKGAIQILDIQGGVLPYEISSDGQFFQPVPALPFLLNGLDPGTYNVQVQDMNDCQTQSTITINTPPLLSIDLGPDEKIKLGDSLYLSPNLNFDPESLEWSPKEFLDDPNALFTFAHPPRSITYRLSATNASGCRVEDEIFIEVDDSRYVYAPSAFHPESIDNSRFTIFGGTDLQSVKSLRIFDRWGGMVFETENLLPNDLQAGWDGTYRGQELSTGVFVFSAVLIYADGAEIPFEGDVLLVR